MMTVQLQHEIPIDLLLPVFRQAARKANAARTAILASLSIDLVQTVDPLAFFSTGSLRFTDRSYWEQPSAGFGLVGFGATAAFRAAGSGRFQELAADMQQLIDSAVIEPSASGQGGPIFLGGFRFDPESTGDHSWPESFAPGLLTLPRFMLTTQDHWTTVTVNCFVEPGADIDTLVGELSAEAQTTVNCQQARIPRRSAEQVVAVEETPDRSVWETKVAEAAADIRAGSFDKIVLARQLRLTLDDDIDPAPMLAKLREANPTARVFAFETPDGCFLGASPELLARRSNGYVEVSCLAGSISRGDTPEQDEWLGQELLNSDKNVLEHDLVARLILDVLNDVCSEVDQGQLHLMKLPTVQHLHTPFQGRLSPGNSLLDVVARLHPTPAVGGYPQYETVDEIRKREGIDRGWYAGPVGWIDTGGHGDFAVALRSGLLTGNQATLYAGCGIVGDSDPAAEYDEAGLKFRPVLAALGLDG